MTQSNKEKFGKITQDKFLKIEVFKKVIRYRKKFKNLKKVGKLEALCQKGTRFFFKNSIFDDCGKHKVWQVRFKIIKLNFAQKQILNLNFNH